VKYFQPNFSHIYVERGALDYPLSQIALKKFSKSKVIEVDHYKDIFNRTGQDFQVQKKSMKLILAKKQNPFYIRLQKWYKSLGPQMFIITLQF